MRKLAKDSMKRLAIILLALVFIVSNVLNFLYKEKAQSNFARNSLGFILSKEDSADFIDYLKELNNTYPDVSLTYISNDGEVLYNPEGLAKSTLATYIPADKNIHKSITSLGPNTYRTDYYVKGSNTLVISVKNNLVYFLNWPFLLILILLYLIILIYINTTVDKRVEDYLAGLYYNEDNISNLDKEYSDMGPVIMSYEDRIDELETEAASLSRRLTEFINITGNMKEGFILFDGQGTIELINESAKKYLGVSRDSTLKNLIDDKEYTLALREASILKRSKSLDLKINSYYLRIFIDPLMTTTQRAFAMIIIDISEERQAEQMRREFSANVTHELKSPLTSINGYAELIAAGIAKEDDISKFGEIIYKEGNRLLEIIDDILKISRLDEGNYDKDFIDLDIYELVTTTIEKYQYIADKKDLSITNNIKPYRIRTSKSLFTDLVSNIYENAIKYNKLGGSITISYELANNNYYLIIADTGIGIPQTDLARIFERFYVVDKSRKRNQKSTGLGLSIVKHIASYLGYDIKVESKLNEGSRFIIEIPLELDR